MLGTCFSVLAAAGVGASVRVLRERVRVEDMNVLGFAYFEGPAAGILRAGSGRGAGAEAGMVS